VRSLQGWNPDLSLSLSPGYWDASCPARRGFGGLLRRVLDGGEFPVWRSGVLDLRAADVFCRFLNPVPSSRAREMDASRRQSGIQQLLAAEQEAQQIVNAARAGNASFILSFGSAIADLA